MDSLMSVRQMQLYMLMKTKQQIRTQDLQKSFANVVVNIVAQQHLIPVIIASSNVN